jgi:hypothetical protein
MQKLMIKYPGKTFYLIPLLLIACSSADLQRTIDVLAEIQEEPLSKNEVADGLRGALIQGISKGSDQASKLDGYYKNPALKIPFPPEVAKVEKTLRDIGLGSEVDKFVRQLNRGAERAAIQAKPIFVDAIRSLTIEDAFSILYGEKNAATNYLKRTTSAPLKSKFLPVVSQSLDEVNATRYYSDIVTRYNKIPLVKKVNPDLDEYATDQAIDGLFLLVAREEANIRANPVARSTELLKLVFGSLDN